jgi:hypothetical protein
MRIIRIEILFMILLLIQVSCGNKASDMNETNQDEDTLNNTNTEGKEVIDEKDFTAFLRRFNRDSVFQKSRIQFPFLSLAIMEDDAGIEYIEQKVMVPILDHQHMILDEPRSSEVDEEVVLKINYIDSHNVHVVLKGQGCGVYLIYKFRNIKGLWYFVEHNDKSM